MSYFLSSLKYIPLCKVETQREFSCFNLRKREGLLSEQL